MNVRTRNTGKIGGKRGLGVMRRVRERGLLRVMRGLETERTQKWEVWEGVKNWDLFM